MKFWRENSNKMQKIGRLPQCAKKSNNNYEKKIAIPCFSLENLKNEVKKSLFSITQCFLASRLKNQ